MAEPGQNSALMNQLSQALMAAKGGGLPQLPAFTRAPGASIDPGFYISPEQLQQFQAAAGQVQAAFGNDQRIPPPQAGPGNLRPGINQGVQAPPGMMIRPDLNGRQQTRVNFLASQGRDIGQKFLQPQRPQTGGGLQFAGGMRPLQPRPAGAPVGQANWAWRRPDGQGGFLR